MVMSNVYQDNANPQPMPGAIECPHCSGGMKDLPTVEELNMQPQERLMMAGTNRR